jgi:hypothetical protein
MSFSRLLCPALLSSMAISVSAQASERHFGFSYESSVLPAGHAELQPWTTGRAGRTDYYERLEARLGFQLGLLPKWQAALFWNAASIAVDTRVPGAVDTVRLTTTDFESMSAQLKYQLSDPVADAVGAAFLVEGEAGPVRVGYEGRLILDKQLGSLLLGFNLFGGGGEYLERRSRFEASFGATVGAGYFITPSVVTSLEVRNQNDYTGKLDHSVLYLGPTISYASTRFWLTLAVQPQIVAFKGAAAADHLELSKNEYVQARLLLGFPL